MEHDKTGGLPSVLSVYDDGRIPVEMTIGGINYWHIKDAAKLTHRSVMAYRALLQTNPTVRQMKALRVRSKLFIPTTELEGYPFVRQGTAKGCREIYHYRITRIQTQEAQSVPVAERYLCKDCSYAQPCACRIKADNLDVPAGDP